MESATPPYSRLEQTSLNLSGVPASQISRLPQIRSKSWSILIAAIATLQGIIGALLLGWLLTESIRSILLQQMNLPAIIGLITLITAGGTLGTACIAAVALISRPGLRWTALSTTALLPIIIEIIDIPIRLVTMFQEIMPLLI